MPMSPWTKNTPVPAPVSERIFSTQENIYFNSTVDNNYDFVDNTGSGKCYKDLGTFNLSEFNKVLITNRVDVTSDVSVLYYLIVATLQGSSFLITSKFELSSASTLTPRIDTTSLQHTESDPYNTARPSGNESDPITALYPGYQRSTTNSARTIRMPMYNNTHLFLMTESDTFDNPILHSCSLTMDGYKSARI